MTVITRGNRLQPEVRRWLLEIGSMVGPPYRQLCFLSTLST